MKDLLPPEAGRAILVRSAGTITLDGLPASELARVACRDRGIDISDHVSRALTREVVEESEIILVMERRHREHVNMLGGDGKVYLLTDYPVQTGMEAEIKDPIGGGLEAYEEVFERLEKEIRRVVRYLVSARH